MSGASRVFFSLHGDPILISSRDDKDEFLQCLMAEMLSMPIEPAEGPQEVPFVDEEEDEDPEEDPNEEEDPIKVEDPIEVEEGPAVDPIVEDEGPIEGPIKDSDRESYIDWDAELQHINDLPPEEEEGEGPTEDPIEDSNGESFIDWDTKLQHIDDMLLEEEEEDEGMWLLDLDEDLPEVIPDQIVESEGPGKPEVVDLIPVTDPQEEEEEDIIADVVQQAQHHV